MQALQENFLYSNSTSGTAGGLEKERQLLVEEQKLCRAKSRKFFLETNRRRKALEERRKLWDVQEQRLRETVLQQRRQRVQDATERFQRAHLPPSQRRRQSFKRNVPSIEDALNHIQGSLSSNNRQSSFVSISRSHTPSPKTPTKPKPFQRQTLSAVEAYTKLLQERSITSFRNNQETQETWNKQQDSSPQENSLFDCIHSESISSKDSLEFEEPKHGTKKLQSSSMSFLLDTDKCLSDMKEHSDLPTFTTKMLLSDTLGQSIKLPEHKQKKQKDSEVPNNKNNITKCSWGFTTNEKAPPTETHHSLSLQEILSSTKQCGIRSTENSPNNNFVVLNSIPPSNTELISLSPKQEPVLDLRQFKANDERQLKHPPATKILLPTKNGNSKDCLFGTLEPNIFLNNCTMGNTCQEETLEEAGKDKHYVSLRKESNASINNLNKISDVELKTEKKTFNTELLHNTGSNNNQSHTPKCLKCPETEEPKSTVSLETSHRVCEVRFIKGILKKHSKYMSGDAACVYSSGHLTLTKQVALAIRDSVELTRAKNKELESNIAVKKKLRWFDEVQVDNEDKGRNIIKQMKGSLCQSKNNSEDHQPSLTSVLGAIKPAPSATHTAPNGYHFTWQAWADVGVQVNLPQQHGDEVKVPPSNNKTNGPKVPLKERTEAGPVSSRTRKGTNIRPQSATEVSQIAKTHGRLVMPRPPPRMDAIEGQKVFVTTTPYGTDPGTEHALQKESPETCFTLYTNHEIRADRSALYTPHPPSYGCPVSESNTKSKSRCSQPETQGCNGRPGLGYHEKGPCLNCTPTEEEISQLWHGVRTALATKDAGLRQHAVDSVRAGRRHSAGLGLRRPPQTTQPAKQPPDQFKQFSIAHGMTFPGEDLQSFVHLNRDEIHNDRSQNIVEANQPQRPGTLQHKHSQRHGLTSLSMEEQKILLSLDRLNHQLHYVQEHVGNTGKHDFLGLEFPSTADPNATNHQKHQAVSYRSRYQKKL